MKRRARLQRGFGLLLTTTTVVLGLAGAENATGAPADGAVAVVTGPNAPELDTFAARELCGYLGTLFGLEVKPSTSIPPPARQIFRDQVARVCGPAALADMLRVFGEVEAATVTLEWNGLGLAFTVPGMLLQHWTPGTLSPELRTVSPHYQAALEAAQRALVKTGPAGKSYVDRTSIRPGAKSLFEFLHDLADRRG